jgi:hypothetical protein
MPQTFEIGKRYADMKLGAYEVLQISGDSMRVRLWNGKETTLAISEQAVAAMLFARTTRLFAHRVQYNANSPATVLQQRIAALRRHLEAAVRDGDEGRADQIRLELVDKRLGFFSLLRTRSPHELRVMRLRLEREAQRETGSSLSYHNVCWACKSDISSARNDQCPECTWYICHVDGACRAPHYGSCQAQRGRMGHDVYDSLRK